MFFDIVIPKLKDAVETLSFAVPKNIFRQTNNIPMNVVYDYYYKNYSYYVNIIFDKCAKLINDISNELISKNIPYMTVVVKNRRDCINCSNACDKQIMTDCLFITMIQKLPRILMPIEEVNKVLKSKSEWNEQSLSLEIAIRRLKEKSISNNKLRNALDEFNKQIVIDNTHPNIIISFRNTNDIFNHIKCDICNTKSDKKACCEKPCVIKHYILRSSKCIYDDGKHQRFIS